MCSLLPDAEVCITSGWPALRAGEFLIKLFLLKYILFIDKKIF